VSVCVHMLCMCFSKNSDSFINNVCKPKILNIFLSLGKAFWSHLLREETFCGREFSTTEIFAGKKIIYISLLRVRSLLRKNLSKMLDVSL